MKRLDGYSDVHTHSHCGPDVITNLPLMAVPHTAAGSAWYSAGIHPWETAHPLPEGVWQWLETAVADDRVVAVGECGLDKLRGAPMPEQERIFLRQVRIASQTGKPLIIHCVRAWERLLALRSHIDFGAGAIIHGFRGKEALARQLLDAGFDLSFGQVFNPAAFEATPPNRRYRESDG